MKVAQHIPGWADGIPPESGEAETTAELLSQPWVVRWTEHPKFHRWSQSAYGDRWLLMCELNEGREWWVIAYLDAEPDLPVWVEPPAPPSRARARTESDG